VKTGSGDLPSNLFEALITAADNTANNKTTPVKKNQKNFYFNVEQKTAI
jgi:hypothetical protein